MDKEKLMELLESEKEEMEHLLDPVLSDDDRAEAIAAWARRTCELMLLLAKGAAETTRTSLDDRAVQVAEILGLPTVIEDLVYDKLKGM